MRMWLVDPSIMCNQHLLGEHLEMHMFRGAILSGKSIQGYLRNSLVVLGKVKKRHDFLVIEMIRRKMLHKSPLLAFEEGKGGFINPEKSLEILLERCSRCKELYTKK